MADEGMRGDLRVEFHETGWGGRPVFIARLVKPGSNEDLLPQMVGARVVRVREAMMIAGMEQVSRGRKSVERYRQTWVCSARHRTGAVAGRAGRTGGLRGVRSGGG
jgi:hypothetical protein